MKYHDCKRVSLMVIIITTKSIPEDISFIATFSLVFNNFPWFCQTGKIQLCFCYHPKGTMLSRFIGYLFLVDSENIALKLLSCKKSSIFIWFAFSWAFGNVFRLFSPLFQEGVDQLWTGLQDYVLLWVLRRDWRIFTKTVSSHTHTYLLCFSFSFSRSKRYVAVLSWFYFCTS